MRRISASRGTHEADPPPSARSVPGSRGPPRRLRWPRGPRAPRVPRDAPLRRSDRTLPRGPGQGDPVGDLRRDPLRPRDGGCGRTTVGAFRPAQVRRRARLRRLHELREPEGARARREPACGARLPLGVPRRTGPDRGGHRADAGRGLRRVLRLPAPRQPHRRLGLSPEPRRREPRRPRCPRRGGRGPLRRLRGPASGLLGRLFPRARRHRVLVRRSLATARPLPLPTRWHRRGLDALAPRALSGLREPRFRDGCCFERTGP